MIHDEDNYKEANLEITEVIGCSLSRALPMKRGRIDSILHQYKRKAFDDQQPCFMTIQGSTPDNNRWVVPPMWKLCPNIVGKPHEIQIELHQSINSK
jgi:hypothetical protein